MNPRGLRRRPTPYWLLPLAGLLIFAAPAWAVAALLGAAAAVTAARLVAGLAGRRSEPGAREGRPGTSGAMVLGVDRADRPAVLSARQLSAHGLILGASGAGKSTTLLSIMGHHIRTGGPVVAIDLKGSPAFAAELGRAAQAAGRRFRVWSLDGPSHWNPLAHGNPTELKDKLIATERFTEPHYQRAAERYVQTVLQVLMAVHPDRPPTLSEVVRAMDPRRLQPLLNRAPRELAERVQDYRSSLTPDQLSAIRGLGTRLAILSESHVGRFLEPGPGGDAIDVRRALAGEEVVLFSLNSSTYGKLAAQVGTLLVQDLIAATGDRLRSPEAVGRAPALVGIDEFSALGADHVVSLLARGRESGVSLLLATQELADLDRAAPGMRDQVLGNVSLKLAHRQDVPASAQAIAQIVGTEQVWEETHQMGSLLLHSYPTGRGSRRLAERFIVHPNEIKNLRTGEAVLITKIAPAQAGIIRVTAPGIGEGRGPARGSVHGPARAAAGGPAREAVPGSARAAAGGPAQGAVPGSARAAAGGPAQGAVPGSARAAAGGPAREAAGVPVQGPTRGPAKAPVPGPARAPAGAPAPDRPGCGPASDRGEPDLGR